MLFILLFIFYYEEVIPINKITNNIKERKKGIRKINLRLTIVLLFAFGILLIFSTYAWFSTNLNVKVKTFNMTVKRNSGLTISFDAINFDTAIELSENMLINELKKTYPNNLSQWAANGLIPVSSRGISDPNSYFFDVYYSNSGVLYSIKNKEKGYIRTAKSLENKIRQFNRYIAFDVFFRNETGSPISDNLYFDPDSSITYNDSDSINEELLGLLNSIRIGIVKVGSLPLDADPHDIQNIKCDNNCTSIIYEPYSTRHEKLSIDRASKYGVNLVNGSLYPTYAAIKEGGPIYMGDTVSGSPNLNTEYFALQNTITEDDLDEPLFTIPDGITKARVYLWIEGQDIDSLETNSDGSDLAISLNFVKDTAGYRDLEE